MHAVWLYSLLLTTAVIQLLKPENILFVSDCFLSLRLAEMYVTDFQSLYFVDFLVDDLRSHGGNIRIVLERERMEWAAVERKARK